MISITISITSPIGEEDRVLLTNTAMMFFAIASQEGALPAQEEEPAEEEIGELENDEPAIPTICAAINPENSAQICVTPAHHRGRHRFRDVPPKVN